MTIFYPDVSNYDSGLAIQPGTVAVCAKASEGRTFTDQLYPFFKAQAAGVGAFFFAYHWLHHGNADAQAAFCVSVVGKTPVMIDCEDTTDHPTVADCIAFADGIRNRGGICTTVYMPKWYWSSIGSPDLRPLTAAGLHLVSSDYVTYSDTGPGWAAYGGVTPDVWQYTDAQSYGGHTVDFNAYRGTLAELTALITGQQAPPAPRPDPPKGHDMDILFKTSDGQYHHGNGITYAALSVKAATDTAYANARAKAIGRNFLLDSDAIPDGAWEAIPGHPELGLVVRMPSADFDYAGPVPAGTTVDTHALATDLLAQLQAAGFNSLTTDGIHAAVKSVLDAALTAGAAAA